MKRALLIGIPVVVAALVGLYLLGSMSDPPGTQAEPASSYGGTATTPDAPATRIAAQQAGCIRVPNGKTDHILSGLTIGASGSLRDAHAIRVDSAWAIISAEVDGPGVEGDGQIATWAVSSLDPGSGMVYSTDDATQSLSRWGDIRTTRQSRLADAPEVAASRACVRSAPE